MYIDLSGEWEISLREDAGERAGKITLPGILQAQGYGNPVGYHTPWVSGLHDEFWYEQEEYQYAQEEGVNVPFLSQPPAHFTGKAYYRKTFQVEREADEEWFFHMELARWRSQVWVDGEPRGGDCSLCAPHEIRLGRLAQGTHQLLVCLDNSMQYPYRPDGHGVSDALGATWNGMVGEIAIYSETENERRRAERARYAAEHPRTVEVQDGSFVIDGRKEYFRATHFGGDYPLTGCPVTDETWWREKMRLMKEFGLNGIRFHSCCPPEAAFGAADKENMYLLVECGMWNRFDEGEAGAQMREVLRQESERILRAFGHHPSFVFFSASNEPSGRWYQPLKAWVSDVRAYDEQLGYAKRRVYTAQSGWFYDEEPSRISGTDFVYFHRSAFGPLEGGVIRNSLGWKGKDYRPSLEGCRLPVVSHELGQWCAYPDFQVIDKFTGYLQPGNYKIFRENARQAGLLEENAVFARCSGENQLRLYKEDLEATFRTPEIKGFELLDLHDYLGQGTALVGVLDAFWEKKSYTRPELFRHFCAETVLLARCSSYVYIKKEGTEKHRVPIEVSHYGKEEIRGAELSWKLSAGDKDLCEGEVACGTIPCGGNTQLGNIEFSLGSVGRNTACKLTVRLTAETLDKPVENEWPVHVFVKQEQCAHGQVLYTREWKQAKAALAQGWKVVFSPYLTELDYDCPSLAMKNVFWNSQMGPTWCRSLGMVIKNGHDLFTDFPTEESGGWQWEDILRHARAFRMDGLEEAEILVRMIDDWNRNLPMGLIWEAKVLEGSLLVCSGDMEGTFEERPEAFSLKRALLEYAASERFCPRGIVCASAIEEKLFPVCRMWELADGIRYDADAEVRDSEAPLQANPNSFVRVEKQDFPVSLEVSLTHVTKVQGLLYVPVQRDRAHEGFVRRYRVDCMNAETGSWETVTEGQLPNTCRFSKIVFDRSVETDTLRLVVLSAYGCEAKEVWKNQPGGWGKVWKEKSAVVQLACLHVLCEEPAEPSDFLFWEKDQKSRTMEIED